MSGSYRTKLAIRFASVDAIKGGSPTPMADALAFFRGDMKAAFKDAFEKADAAIAAVKASHDNPYGNNDEAIAKAIIDKVEENDKKRRGY